MLHDFLFHFGDLVDRWAERSLARAEAWGEQSQPERLDAAAEMFRTGRRQPRRGPDGFREVAPEWPPAGPAED
jgi:hypothetical protein